MSIEQNPQPMTTALAAGNKCTSIYDFPGPKAEKRPHLAKKIIPKKGIRHWCSIAEYLKIQSFKLERGEA